jgi:hypothetical protein
MNYPILRVLLLSASVAHPVALAYAQTLQVKIIDRKDIQTDYSYVVPSRFYSNSSSTANCGTYGNNVNCNASSSESGFATPAQQVPFQVQGATFLLLLPDGRGAVVNCRSKFAERMAGPRGNHRDCRVPLVDNIQAEFKGDKAKLEWVVSLDGKKMQSETYKVLAILDKPPSTGQ